MSEFKKAIEDVNRQFKEIEDRNRVRSLIESKAAKKAKMEPTLKEKIRKEQEDLEIFSKKEKGINAFVVFVVGHITVGHLYFAYPELSLALSLTASFSLLFICLAVYEYS